MEPYRREESFPKRLSESGLLTLPADDLRGSDFEWGNRLQTRLLVPYAEYGDKPESEFEGQSEVYRPTYQYMAPNCASREREAQPSVLHKRREDNVGAA
jgi:hypothetical protein